MNDLDKVIRTLFDKFDEATMGSLVIFYIGICFIALIVDFMLLGTFPAFTLIGIVLLIMNVSIKAYNNFLIKKNSKYFENINRKKF